MERLDAVLDDYVNSHSEEEREELIDFLFNYLTTEELNNLLRKWKKQEENKKIKS